MSVTCFMAGSTLLRWSGANPTTSLRNGCKGEDCFLLLLPV
uniref:Uncharacterized protein n=1 Tax=Leptobrachium leishanense TaxID=445787 RepID=A0A8C5PXT5_9ANUR